MEYPTDHLSKGLEALEIRRFRILGGMAGGLPGFHEHQKMTQGCSSVCEYPRMQIWVSEIAVAPLVEIHPRMNADSDCAARQFPGAATTRAFTCRRLCSMTVVSQHTWEDFGMPLTKVWTEADQIGHSRITVNVLTHGSILAALWAIANAQPPSGADPQDLIARVSAPDRGRVHPDHACSWILGKSLLVFVLGVRRTESGAIGFYELVSDDDDLAKAGRSRQVNNRAMRACGVPAKMALTPARSVGEHLHRQHLLPVKRPGEQVEAPTSDDLGTQMSIIFVGQEITQTSRRALMRARINVRQHSNRSRSQITIGTTASRTTFSIFK